VTEGKEEGRPKDTPADPSVVSEEEGRP